MQNDSVPQASPVGQDGAGPSAAPASRIKSFFSPQTRELEALRTPIDFYGKVVDQNNVPVADAVVKMGAVDNPSEQSSKYERRTDERGLFSITGIRGAALLIFVSKDGYHPTAPMEPVRYAIRAMHDPPLPTSSKPMLFTLRKKGEVEPLIHTESCISVPFDGNPVQMSLRKSVWRAPPAPPWDIQLEYSMKSESGGIAVRPYEWHLRISVPNGGIVRRMNRNDFVAPTEGYRDFDEIHMAKDETRWRPTATQDYFVKLANGNYGRFSIRINTGNDNYVLVESFINPSGSLNLEFDPKKTIQRGSP